MSNSTPPQARRQASSAGMGMRGPGPGRGHGHGRFVERPSDAKGALRRLLGYLWPHRVAVGVVLVLAVVSTSMALVGPYLLGVAVNLIAEQEAMVKVFRVCLWMLGAYFVSWGANSLQGVILATAAQKVMRKLRQDLFNHLQMLSLSYFDHHSSGDLMSRLTNDIDTISRVLSQNGTQLFTGALTLVGVVGVMFALNVWLTLASLVVFPIMFVLVGFVAKRTRKAYRGYQAKLGELNTHLEETYSGQRVVMAFGQQDKALRKIETANEEVRRLGTHAMIYALLAMPLMGILSNANVAILAGLGGWMVIQSYTSIGLIVSFITYSRRFAEPMRQLGDLYGQVQSSLAGAERIFEILDTQPDQLDRPDAVDLTRVRGDVEFQGVDFSYVPNVPVLKDVHLHAYPGQTIALVGPTGAGKTTIVNLLSRFYEIDRGAILIDGANICSLTRSSLR
ncbi:ABC transporter ATP-binding protein, partial [Candidatus Bipolaricaulota bacterium]|nr:ABC transporter ATP-binding protein [Candidatus Bipolaricaulota bacterium]